MRVGLNATCFDDRPSGANQRFALLYGALVRRNPDTQFVIYEPVDQRIARWFDGAPNVTARVTPVPSSGRFNRLRAGLGYWRRALREDRLDLYETFSLPLVAAPDCPTILTVHDLRPIAPANPLPSRLAGAAVIHRAFARADHIVTVSQTMQAEIERFHPGARISTIYNAVPAKTPQTPTGASDGIGGADDAGFILTVGHFEARKNLPRLIDAIALLRDRGRPRRLLLVGNDAGARSEILARIARHDLGGLVEVREGASNEAVAALYASARLVVIPSLYEGFGIPLIEAMAAGCPLVTSDITVFREIREDRGPFFAPDDVEQAAIAIERGWSDDIVRAESIAYGLDRARDFTPDRLADQISALHQAMLAPPR